MPRCDRNPRLIVLYIYCTVAHTHSSTYIIINPNNTNRHLRLLDIWLGRHHIRGGDSWQNLRHIVDRKIVYVDVRNYISYTLIYFNLLEHTLHMRI